MRLTILASLFTAGAMWIALGGNPAQSQDQAKPASCQTCGQSAAGTSCPHCAKGQSCPHCDQGKACAHCNGGPHHGWHAFHKHEYKCVHQSERANKKAADEMSAQFSALGEDGWRLAKADAGFWCFSRVRAAQ